MRLCARAARGELRRLAKRGLSRAPLRPHRTSSREHARALESFVAETASNNGVLLNLAIDYGGRREIGDAVRALIEEVRAGLRDGCVDRRTRAGQPALHRRPSRSRSRSSAPAANFGYPTSSVSVGVRRVLGDADVLAGFRRKPFPRGARRFRLAPAPLRNIADPRGIKRAFARSCRSSRTGDYAMSIGSWIQRLWRPVGNGAPSRAIAVLGMHRSGTSAITRGVAALGSFSVATSSTLSRKTQPAIGKTKASSTSTSASSRRWA